MVLKESIDAAIIKMEKSYKSYEWLLRNPTSFKEDYHNYAEHFSDTQDIFSAIDILLRCFIIEKKIPMYAKNKQIIVTEQMDDYKFTTNDFCCGILAYNEKNCDSQWLTDVDFSCFIDDYKRPRNMDEHLGITGIVQDLYRIYHNVNKLCAAINATNYTLNINKTDNTFDYSRFDACMDEMDETDRRYILLADSMHNVNKELLETFLQIPWSIILDFDGASSMGGLKSILESEDYSGRDYTPHVYSEFTMNNNIKFSRAYINLCEEPLCKRFTAKKQESQDNYRIPAIVDKVSDSIHSKATIVVTGLQTERVRDICKLIKLKFYEIDVIFLTNQGQIQLLEKTEANEWSESGNIAAVNVFNNTIFEVMQSIYDNRKFFSDKIANHIAEENLGLKFNALDNTELIVKDMNLLHGKEGSFEFMHLNLGEDVTQCNEWEFYHGDIASWETIRNGFVESLIDKNRLKAFENEIKRDQSGACFTVYHLPGFGGTTLGRLIAWDLHKEMPVVCLKTYESIQTLSKDIGDIYTHIFAKHKFLILIDEDDFSLKQMQELEKMIMDSEYTLKALFIRRINDSDIKKKHVQNMKNELVFSALETGAKETLKSKCYHLLKEKGQEYCYAKREKYMNTNLNERDKCALIVNLYLLEENFNLENYVRKFLDRLGKDSDEEKYQKLLGFIAIGDYYSNLKIPAAYIACYLDGSGKLKVRNIEDRLRNYDGLLLKSKMQESGDICYGIKHYLIAREILKQTLKTPTGENWQGILPELVKELIDFLYLLVKRTGKIDKLMQNIICGLFTDKTKSRWYRENDDENVYDSSFTSLLASMGEYKKNDIINYLANRFQDFIKSSIPVGQSRVEYKVLAHIYAQRARIRSKSERLGDNEEIQDLELEQYMQETMSVINTENICEYDLEHMLGMCYLERARRLRDKSPITEELHNIFLANIQNAIKRFDYTIWYGSPDYGVPCKINAITTALEEIINYNNVSSKDRLEKLYHITEAKIYIDDGLKAVQDIDEYALGTIARTIAEKRRDEFERVCFPDKASEFLQRLDNLGSKLSAEDYEGHYMVSSMAVYAYEKKYYVKEYRRSSLIYKALSGDRKAIEDAKKVFGHLDRILKMSNEHSVSFSTYNRWFEYAKYMVIPLVKAYEQASNWKQVEKERENSGFQRNNLIRPCYYLFVIQLLRYCEEENITGKDVSERKQDLSRQISSSRANDVVQDWYANRKGLGHLYSREWVDVKNVDTIDCIAEVQGKVVYVDETKNNYGYLRILHPHTLNTWSNAPKGSLYNTDSDVYFVERQTNIISKNDLEKTKKFKFGFSYSKMIASTNSLENRNIVKTTVRPRNSKKEENQQQNENNSNYSD